jgi:RNA polymerase sigma-70 factor (ECF subfamily)
VPVIRRRPLLVQTRMSKSPEDPALPPDPTPPPHSSLTAEGNPRLTNRMPQTDAATVALARDGNSEAFRALVERHSRAVFRLAHRMTGSAQDAEDVVQETFLRAYKQLGRFESRANFGTWLHRIAVNCSIDLIRSRPHRETSHESDDLELFGAAQPSNAAVGASPERLTLSAEVQRSIERAMSALSQMERSAFVLRHFEGQSIDEISRALGLKTNATKHSIFRAVKKMRLALEPFVTD